MEIKAQAKEYLKTILCYPTFDQDVFLGRQEELRELGVSEVYSRGAAGLSKWRILGKGHVGVVVAARHGGGVVALKVLRMDSDRETLEHEGALLSYANEIGIGPLLMRCSRNFMITELIEGAALGAWTKSKGEANDAELCARSLLSQGYRLDQAGLDHGELSRPDKHILVQAGGSPVILDFESASVQRRCNNLTSLVQYLFIRRGDLCTRFAPLVTGLEMRRLLGALSLYRIERSHAHYQEVLRILGLD